MAWKIENSHKWILKPHTVYEIRRELRVREKRQTAIAWDKRYFDVESQKYITDKLETIQSYNLHEVIDDSYHNRYWCDDPRYYSTNIYDGFFHSIEDLFVPKDNDFDDECRRDEEEDNRKYHESMLKKQQMESYRLKREYLEQQKKIEDKLKEDIKKREEEIAYQKKVRESELRSAGWFGVCDSPKNMTRMSNIRPNSWKPK